MTTSISSIRHIRQNKIPVAYKMQTNKQTNKEMERKLEKKREVIEAENNLQQKRKPPEPPEEPQPAVPKAKEKLKVTGNMMDL